MELEQFEFSGVTGVGDIHVDLESGQRVYTFIGANGVGKTKLLEALFQVLFFSNTLVNTSINSFNNTNLFFNNFTNKNLKKIKIESRKQNPFNNIKMLFTPFEHQLPIVYLNTKSRTLIQSNQSVINERLGTTSSRRLKYFNEIFNFNNNGYQNASHELTTERWFVTMAQSSNPFQSSEDNRGFEVSIVTNILNQIDSRIDANFLEIDGDDRVSLKIENQKRKLSELSSGFVSLVKLVQSIVSGYGYFTNETDIQNVKGIVLIDEIESHLHLSWQANIIPMLKKLFPNTTFFIATHSSVVLSQLKEGEAYQLKRDEHGTVRSYKIPAPNKAALADILKDVFDIDLNAKKLANASASDQRDAKNALLELLKKQGGGL